MENVDICYYINLEKRTDRRDAIENTLKSADIFDISERIDAIYDKHNGALGCSKSHVLSLEKFIDSGFDTCLVIEDDLVLHNSSKLKENINKIFENSVDFDVIQISGNHINVVPSEHSFLYKVNDSQTTSGYIITKDFAPILLNNFKDSSALMERNGKVHDNCLDIYWKKLQPISKWYTFIPVLGIQANGVSDIENKNVRYGV